MDPTIRCGHCKQDLPIESFNPSQRKNGKWCKSCLRASYVEQHPPDPPRPCAWCGETIQNPRGARHLYCSSACKQRAKWKRDHPATDHTCLVCGADISHMRSNAKWCSTACSNKRPSARATRRRAMLKANYGLSPDQVVAMLAAQGNRCAICGSETPKTHHDQWHVDHDHTTGKVRGLLCGPCNTGLGQLQDDPVVIRAALAYVERHR